MQMLRDLSKKRRSIIEICVKCNLEMDILDLDCTLHRKNWYHLVCWKQTVGLIKKD